jgi:hypothetical protein
MYPGEKKKTAANRRDRHISSQSGASLLLLIIGLLIMGVLGAAMYAITSTSYFNQASAQDAMKAQYITESGQRIVASEYKAGVAASTPNAKLADLNGRTFGTGGSSTLTINIYPYWLYGSTSGLTGLKLPGSLPLRDKDGTTVITFPKIGLLRIENNPEVISFTDATAGSMSGSGTPITFGGTNTCYTCASPCTSTPTVCSAYPSIVAETKWFVGFVQNDATTPARILPDQTVTKGGNLTLNVGSTTSSSGSMSTIATFFPPEDGTFTLISSPTGVAYNYHYDKREIGASTTILYNIQSACASAGCPPVYPDFLPGASFLVKYPVTPTPTNLLNPAETTQIFVGKNLGIRSTGLSGN